MNRFYYPDHGATAQILSDVAEHLAAKGWDVHVITSRLSYSDTGLRHRKKDTHKGVRITRLATSGFGRGTLLGRALDYGTFYGACFFSVLKHVRRSDIVVVKTDPPLLSVPVSVAARFRRASQINWVQDLFPDIAGQLGVGLATGWTGNILRTMRNKSFAGAARNVVIGERMAEHLIDDGLASNQVKIIPNFADDEALRPTARGVKDLRRGWGFDDEDFVVGYSGNLGRAHEVETVIKAARLLSANPKIKFLFVGGGHLKQTVEQKVFEYQLTNVSFQPYQPRVNLAASLSVPDVHWISLQPYLEGMLFPSKLYGIAAVGKPVIMIGDQNGDIGRLVKRHAMGLCFRPGDSEALADAIRGLEADRKIGDKFGAAARGVIDKFASRQRALSLWRGVLTSI